MEVSAPVYMYFNYRDMGVEPITLIHLDVVSFSVSRLSLCSSGDLAVK